MIHHTSAVSRGTERALVIADMPFLTYQVTVSEAVRNAGRLLQEGGAAAVKIEGGRPMLDVVRRLVDVGIPVMGHVGVLPQSVHQLGGYAKRGTQPQDGDAIVADAEALEEAGAFAIVLESIPSELARTITARVGIPTIGIGAGPIATARFSSATTCSACSISAPSFVKQYARLGDEIVAATEAYIEDVQAGRYPAAPAKAVGGRTT